MLSIDILSFHVDLRWLLFRKPYGFQEIYWLAMSSVGLRKVWTIQFHLPDHHIQLFKFSYFKRFNNLVLQMLEFVYDCDCHLPRLTTVKKHCQTVGFEDFKIMISGNIGSIRTHWRTINILKALWRTVITLTTYCKTKC